MRSGIACDFSKRTRFLEEDAIPRREMSIFQGANVLSARSSHDEQCEEGYTGYVEFHLLLCVTPVQASIESRNRPSMRLPRTWRGITILVLSAAFVWSCGYVGLDTNDDMFVPGATGGLQPGSGGLATGGVTGSGGAGTGGVGTGGVGTGGAGTGGAGSGGVPGSGGELGWGGFGGLGGYGGAGGDCEASDVCDFSCIQSPCRVDCPAEATCTIESQGMSRVISRCREGALCQMRGAEVPVLTFACQGAGDCESKCQGADECSAQCAGSGSCVLYCEDTNCSVQCASTSQCMMVGGAADRHVCAGEKRYCANGVTTCNRPCP